MGDTTATGIAAGRRRRGAVAAVLLAVWGLAVAPPARASGDAADELFGASTIRADNLAAFPRWTGALARYLRGEEPRSRVCRGDVFSRCRAEEWKGFLESLVGLDPMTQIRRVNERMNKARYILDINNYNEPDYWATPNEFFRLNGDCEDYAIAKFLSLRALGFANDSLRVVVLDDLNLRTAHAVLVVVYDGRTYVLDNQIAQVVPANVIRHYKPIYALNETNWWLYRTRGPAS